MGTKTRIRAAALSVIALSVLVTGYAYATEEGDASLDAHLGPDGPTDPSATVAPPREGVTVIATDSNTWRGLGVDGPRSRSELVALGPNGNVRYYDDSHTRYWDVDPVTGTAATVEYGYSDHLEGTVCESTDASRHAVDEATWERYDRARPRDEACTRNGVERVNLTTGEVTPVWSRVTPGKDGTRYHDADRINATHWAVADIYLDRVFVLNASSDRIVWAWNASDAFETDSGGPYPEDWTHINDVEVLPDGRFMVSVRNQDQVVFVDPGEGVDEAWTLGAEGDHGVLYEQHNPDYIPESRGGPSVLVADSENGRVQEFLREDGEWRRTWTWSDGRAQWPRDADRLPNGHTLIADSNGDRVVEVDASGAVVWSVDVAFPYEVERLGTGDESDGGPSATRSTASAAAAGGRPLADLWLRVEGKYLNVALYLAPAWMGPLEVVSLALAALAAVAEAVLEAAWAVRSRH